MNLWIFNLVVAGALAYLFLSADGRNVVQDGLDYFAEQDAGADAGGAQAPAVEAHHVESVEPVDAAPPDSAPERWSNVFTGEAIAASEGLIALRDAFAQLPVAMNSG